MIYWLDSKPGWGVGLEYTHSKAYAKLNGTTAGALYDTLEFTDGNNIVTGNILYRFSPWEFYRIRPYAGFGIGVTIPHVEVSLVGDPVKTFEYQLAGFAGQGFVGLEMPFTLALVRLCRGQAQLYAHQRQSRQRRPHQDRPVGAPFRDRPGLPLLRPPRRRAWRRTVSS